VGEADAKINFDEFPSVSYEEWKEAAIGALKGAPFEKSMYTSTYEGITLDPLYTAENTKNLDSPRSFPGAGSLLRGTNASGYIAAPWEIAQPADALLPEDAGGQVRHELEKGASAAAVLLDGASLRGLDADAGSAADSPGVSLSTLEDVEKLFGSLSLERSPIHLYAGASSAPLLGFVAAFAKKRGIPLDRLSGCIGADPFGAWLQNGALCCGTDRLFDEMAQGILWTEKHMPRMRTVLIRGSVVHNGGGNAIQEAGGALAAAIEAIRAMSARQVDVNAFARHLRFEFSLGSNFFMEIAKIRAVREIWAQIVDAFGGEESAKKANIFGRTSFFTKTLYDPYVNMLRNTTEAFSGVLAGLDGLTVGCFDEAAGPGDEFSRRIARNTQILLKEEFSLLQPVDPAGGAWYLETLTDTLARKIWEWIQNIEKEGGFSAGVRSGTLQSSVEKILAERFKRLASRSDRAVGTNMYPNMEETETLSKNGKNEGEDPSRARGRRLETLKKFRAARDGGKCQKALEQVTVSGLAGGEPVDRIVLAAEAGATLGEVRARLNDGQAPDITPVAAHRWTEQYEALRLRTEKFRQDRGSSVKIFLANMGPIPQHKARADFITGFMEVAGFDVLKNSGFPTTEECAAAAAASGADVAVICSTDDSYPELVPPLARSIREKAPGLKIFLAGAPKEEFKQSYLDAGVNDFISVRSNCLSVLTDLQKAKGMF
jgi:methylmalonyl-CoA mutase